MLCISLTTSLCSCLNTLAFCFDMTDPTHLTHFIHGGVFIYISFGGAWYGTFQKAICSSFAVQGSEAKIVVCIGGDVNVSLNNKISFFIPGQLQIEASWNTSTGIYQFNWCLHSFSIHLSEIQWIQAPKRVWGQLLQSNLYPAPTDLTNWGHVHCMLKMAASLGAEGKCKAFSQAKASFSAPGARAREIIMSGVIWLGPQAQLWRRWSNSCGGRQAEASEKLSAPLTVTTLSPN